MEKRKPAFVLADVQALIKKGVWNMTRRSWTDAHALGFAKDDVQSILLDLTPGDFYKSMTSNYNAAIWQDVYHSIFKFLGNLFKSKAEKNFDHRNTWRISRIKIFFQRRSWEN